MFSSSAYSCNKNSSMHDSYIKTSQHQQQMSCSDSGINKTAMFVVGGVIVSLLLVLLIVTTVRHVYKPLRPRIKKTFVVHKNVVPTPLTCRPTTEQCEITIENCCNMNICDTVSVYTTTSTKIKTTTTTQSRACQLNHIL